MGVAIELSPAVGLAEDFPSGPRNATGHTQPQDDHEDAGRRHDPRADAVQVERGADGPHGEPHEHIARELGAVIRDVGHEPVLPTVTLIGLDRIRDDHRTAHRDTVDAGCQAHDEQ